MNKKVLLLLVFMICIITPAFGFEVSQELKAGVSYLVKISIGVFVSSIVIGVGLWVYSLIKGNHAQLKSDKKISKFKCEIDDTNSFDEAIQTFLNINN